MDQAVLFSEMPGKYGDIGIITLNRPQALNALTHDMIHLMHDQLKKWAKATSIKAVIVRAVEGRAFCAGGDLKLTYDRSREKHPMRAIFFHDEYALNKFIFHFPKPYIAFLDGITMGGGVGISIHGSHRVATEKLLFAMPETGIGFFPDVGGTYFLPRLPGYMGYYLGLTGARLKVDDALHLGLVTDKVDSASLEDLLQALAAEKLAGDAKRAVSEVIKQFSAGSAPSSLALAQPIIDECFSKSSMESILSALRGSSHPLCQEALTQLSKKSPTSLKVTLKAFSLTKDLDFDAVMEQEYRLARHFLDGHDFPEGIRAVIIDKDQMPHWEPSTLDAVTDLDVTHYF